MPAAFPEISRRLGRPEHHERAERLQAALEVARRAPPPLVQGDAFDILPRAVEGVSPRGAVCIFHSATLTYFSQDERRRFAELVTSLAGRRNVFWVWLEDPGVMDKVVGPSAGLANLAEPSGAGLLGIIRFQGGDRTEHTLGRGPLHGGWVEWLASDFP
jgi:hypothetical protein